MSREKNNDRESKWTVLSKLSSRLQLVGLIAVLTETAMFVTIPYMTTDSYRLLAYIGMVVIAVLSICFAFFDQYLDTNSKQVEETSNNFKLLGITKYWESKEDAIEEVKACLTNFRTHCIILGVNLNTIALPLKNESVTQEVVRRLSENPDARLIFVTHLPNSVLSFMARDIEKPRDLFRATAVTIENLANFKLSLTRINRSILERVEFRHYGLVFPRHFLLKFDQKIFFSPYFSSSLGGSFLLGTESTNQRSLFEYFDREINHILKDSVKFDPLEYQVPAQDQLVHLSVERLKNIFIQTDDNPMMRLTQMKSLYLMRHSRASRSKKNTDDFSRPLTQSGNRDAKNAGKFIARLRLFPEMVLASPSTRTRQTLQNLIEGAGGIEPIVLYEDHLYNCNSHNFIQFLQNIEDRWSTVLIIGHSPSIVESAAILTGSDDLQNKFEPGCIAIVNFNVDSWQKLCEGRGELQSFYIPD